MGSIATISNSNFSANVATKNGGAINNNLQVTISSSNFSGNNAQFGGAILNKDIATISNSNFSTNSASANGGAVNNNGKATIANSTFSNNSAQLDGGAFYNNGTTAIANSTFSNNSAQINGGAILNFIAATISNSTFSGNSASSNGGAINNNGVVAIASSTLSANSAIKDGGAIFSNGKAIINNSTFGSNNAKNNGGAIFTTLSVTDIDYSTFFGNSSDKGGAIFNSDNATTNIGNSIVIGNKAVNGNEIFNRNTLVLTGPNIVGTNGVSGIDGTFTGISPIIPTGGANTVINTTLANNGGPTKTFALSPRSIAINASNNRISFDQRGFLSLGIRDIGAFEFTVRDIDLDIDPNRLARRDEEKPRSLTLSSFSALAFLSIDDIEFQRLDRFLIVIVELMNKDGGDLAIDTKDIWKDADISIFDQSTNQNVIKVAIRRSIGRFIGNEFIDLVDVNFESKKDKKSILLKVRKSPKPAKFFKD